MPPLGKVAALRQAGRAQARTRWRPHQRRVRRPGQGEPVMVAVQRLWRGRPSQARRTPRDACSTHQSRRAYATLLALQRPIGSGASARAGRRGRSLRWQGPSLVWWRARAAALRLLRASDKAGRWTRVQQMATAPLALLAA